MANSVSAKKRIRQNETHRALNKWRKVTMRNAIKSFDDKIMHASADEAAAAFREASKLLDKSAQKGVIHKNMAARKKSRMAARLKAKSGK